jgi:hypothetical protein
MRKLAIKIIESQTQNTIENIICEHLDASNHITILSSASFKHLDGAKVAEIFTIPAHIHHWHLMDGMITIYYDSGFEIEITRIND